MPFFSRLRTPIRKAWSNHDYWRRAIDDLLLAYKNICSYSGSWTKANVPDESTIQDSSVDHFIPKSKASSQAYEWANFRLCRVRLNNHKRQTTTMC